MTRPEPSVRFQVRVRARGGRDEIEGVTDGRLSVRVAASPVDGAANAAVERAIAEALDLPNSSVRIVKGATARLKTVEVSGLSREALIGRWPDLVV